MQWIRYFGVILGRIKMKKIALIMDGWKRFFSYAWPSGMLQRMRETKEEVNLYIFNSTSEWSMDEDYNIGEYNIYNLPDFKEFDGIVVDLNNIRNEKVRAQVIDAVRKSKKPAISINHDVEGFYYAGIDNYVAMQEIIQHLYEKHHCRSFWFVMGPTDNYENNIRACSLRAFLERHNIAYEEEDFYFESYEYQCGYHGFMSLLERNGNVPDAIVCANDNIAVGVCEAAAKKGYRIPNDFCVTGFDNFDKAGFYTPQISTLGHLREEVGYCCADIMLKIWEGKQVPKFNYTKIEGVYSESCGCGYNKKKDIRKYMKEQMMCEIEMNCLEENILVLEKELLDCKSVGEMANLIPKCIPSFQCDGIYLIMDEHINDFKRKTTDCTYHLMDNQNFFIHGYPRHMNVEFAYEEGRTISYADQKIDSLFPFFEHEKGGTDFLFMPLHFRKYTVGYFVIRNAIYLMEKQYLFKIVNVLTSAMENLYEKEKMEYINGILEDMSIRDCVTGLYNRLGYQRLAYTLFHEKKQEKKNLLIMFLDMDRLKYINDEYGHEYGDIAIKIVAKAILKFCYENALPIRMGGDEFLIIEPMKNDEEINKKIEHMRKEIGYLAKEKQLPFPLSFSIGCIVTDMNMDKELDDYIREADEVMYEEKYRKKVNRTE